MQTEVFLIGKTQVDWGNYLSIAKQAIGRSISQGIDSHKMAADTLAAFVCTLDDFLDSASDPIDSLRRAGVLLDHIHYSFLVVADTSTFYYLMQNTNLRINITPSQVFDVSAGIVSGSLLKLREAVLNLLSGRESRNVRVFLDKVMLILEHEGFKEIFSDYKKQMLPDKSFKLIEKK